MAVRRTLAIALVLALAVAGAALAARGDPQKRITRADQARAKAMVLRKADFGSGFMTAPSPSGQGDVYCKALDESDLTITGEAQSPSFVGGVASTSSLSRVYESVADSNASWRRGTSKAGERCLRVVFSKTAAAQGGRLTSLERLRFPKVAQRTSAYRLVIEAQGLRGFLDVVALKQSRAQVGLLFVSALNPTPRGEEVRLARIVARRMKTAMRGA